MAIAIDDWMVDFRPHLLRGHVRTHDLLRENNDWTREQS
jgi:hypothetical protein